MNEGGRPLLLIPKIRHFISLTKSIWGEGGGMGRHSCCYKQKLRKGLWSPDEDEKLLSYITKYGHGCWSSVPKLAGNSLSALHGIDTASTYFIRVSIFVFKCMLTWGSCRAAEVWEELQAQVDQLP